MKTRFVSAIWVSLIAFLMIGGQARGEERTKFFDAAIGAGMNLDGNGTEQFMIIPAYNARIGETRLWGRVEADFEIINDSGKITAVLGLSPFLRYYLNERRVRPFFELGAGANVITRNHTAHKVSGGAFIFSPSAGGGLQFESFGRPATVSLRFRHLSNADIYRFNESLNSVYLLFSIGIP